MHDSDENVREQMRFEINELETQSYNWWRKAEESTGQDKADIEKLARDVDSRIRDLWHERRIRIAK